MRSFGLALDPFESKVVRRNSDNCRDTLKEPVRGGPPLGMSLITRDDRADSDLDTPTKVHHQAVSQLQIPHSCIWIDLSALKIPQIGGIVPATAENMLLQKSGTFGGTTCVRPHFVHWAIRKN